MHIKKTHKYANHKTLIMKILIFKNLFNNNNLAIGRRYNCLFSITIKVTLRTSKEVYGNTIYYAEDYDKEPKGYFIRNIEPKN